MTLRLLALSAAAAMVLAGAASADQPPPSDAQPLSQLLSVVEQQSDFHYVDEIEWEDRGSYKVEYVTKDGRERTVRIDARSGQLDN